MYLQLIPHFSDTNSHIVFILGFIFTQYDLKLTSAPLIQSFHAYTVCGVSVFEYLKLN